MWSSCIRFIFFLLVLNQFLVPSSSLRSFRNGGRSYKENAPKVLIKASPGIPAQNAVRRGLGISAWGIVALVTSIILAGMGFYYFTMCYPILCKKERKYDMIGLPSVA